MEQCFASWWRIDERCAGQRWIFSGRFRVVEFGADDKLQRGIHHKSVPAQLATLDELYKHDRHQRHRQRVGHDAAGWRIAAVLPLALRSVIGKALVTKFVG